jgi:hypothetical protein
MPRGGGVFKIIRQKTLNSDSHIKKLDNGVTITSDAYIKATQTKTLNSDAMVKRPGEEGSINSDAYIKKSGNDKSITSDAYIKKLGNAETITSDSYIEALQEGTITSDAYITGIAHINSDSYIKRGGDNPSYGGILNTWTNTETPDSSTTSNTFSGNYPRTGGIYRMDINMRAVGSAENVRIKISTGGNDHYSNYVNVATGGFVSYQFDIPFPVRGLSTDAVTVTKEHSGTVEVETAPHDNSGWGWHYQPGPMATTYTVDDVLSDAEITEAIPEVIFEFDYAITSDAEIKAVGEGTITSDAVIDYLHFTEIIYSDAEIKATSGPGINSDAYIKKLDNTETIDGDSYIGEIQEETITSDAWIYSTEQGDITSDAIIKKLDNTETITSDGYIIWTQSEILNGDANIVRIGIPYKIYPVGIDQDYNLSDPDERIRFRIPFDSDGDNMDIHIQVASDAGFTNIIGNFYSWQYAGRWTYYDGSSFVAWPSAGIPPTSQLQEGRFRIQGLINPEDLIQRGVWYWRLRGVNR